MTIKLSPALRAVLLAVGMIGFLLLMAGLQLTQRATGTEVVLQAYPVDPRSLFRGYYVILRTDISEVDTAALDGSDDFSPGDVIYVTLVPTDDGVWAPTSLSATKPTPSASSVAVRGRVTRVYAPYREPDAADAGEIVDVRYNLESYFAEEDAAKELEVSVREGHLRLIASVTPNGVAVVKGLEIDGVRYIDDLF